MTRVHADVYERLREGKRTLRNQRRAMSLAEKVAQVVELQRLVLPAIRANRTIEPWKRVWDLNSSTTA
ncbi:MAG TPA: hypothetical protein VHL58_02295 [Thermoanaerobaculia bacterium]|nr:hypothetical protein [Thermoanaerobaculia bacterium]